MKIKLLIVLCSTFGNVKENILCTARRVIFDWYISLLWILNTEHWTHCGSEHLFRVQNVYFILFEYVEDVGCGCVNACLHSLHKMNYRKICIETSRAQDSLNVIFPETRNGDFGRQLKDVGRSNVAKVCESLEFVIICDDMFWRICFKIIMRVETNQKSKSK